MTQTPETPHDDDLLAAEMVLGLSSDDDMIAARRRSRLNVILLIALCSGRNA